jgi:hypothetical protein
MHPMNWKALLAVFAVGGLVTTGCPAPPPPIVDAGEPEDAGFDAGEPDAGDPDVFPCTTDQQCQTEFNPETVCDDIAGSSTFGLCVPRCSRDEQCERYATGLRCQEQTGHCILGRGCQNDTNCPPNQFDPSDYCNITGPGCRCVTEDHPSGLGGVCRRRLSVCDECVFDEQCGNGVTFDPQGRCRSLQGDPSGALPDGGTRQYCFYAEQGVNCPCGMVRTVEGLCVPQSGSCGQVGCTTDDECPFGSVCGDTGGTCGLCEARCSWNFDQKKQNPPGCGPGKTCWVDPGNLNPSSPYFGAGRCRPPCEDDAQCKALDPRMECRAESIAGGGQSEKRCRPAGECMDDFECPQPNPGDIYLGYCDRASFTCKTDCRPGIDPVTGSPYDDCTSGYKCVNQNGNNVCLQQTCLEQGGARLACNAAHYCCGEDKNGDGTADACPASGVGADQCYLSARPPFCQTCMTHADCANLPNPSGSNLPHRCLYTGDRAPMVEGVSLCGIATHNDWAVDALNISKAHRGCPAKYNPVPVKIRCMQPSDCDQPGQPGSGNCGPDPYEKLADGGVILTCLCTANGNTHQTAGCPAPNVDAGVLGYCRHAPAGTQQYCLSSVVCMPGANTIYTTANFGCGIP